MYVWQMQGGRWHVSAYTGASPKVGRLIDMICPPGGFETKAAAEHARMTVAACLATNS